MRKQAAQLLWFMPHHHPIAASVLALVQGLVAAHQELFDSGLVCLVDRSHPPTPEGLDDAVRAKLESGVRGTKVSPGGVDWQDDNTPALGLTAGDARAVQEFSRHRDVRTLMIYDDARTDTAGFVASQVAAGLIREGQRRRVPAGSPGPLSRP